MWDLRSKRYCYVSIFTHFSCVRKFTEHKNNTHTIGLAFSPCFRYIATGSEDRVAYLYDINSGLNIHKLYGHSDVVSSVSFNPLCPQIVTSSFDGTIRLFSE